MKSAFPDGRRDGVQPYLRGQRVEFRRATAFDDRLRYAHLEGQSERELIVGERVIRVERDCLAELRFRAFPIVFVEKLEDAERCVPFGGIAVELNCLYRGSLRLWPGLG